MVPLIVSLSYSMEFQKGRGLLDIGTDIGVFHAMAGMAAAMPGLFKFPSAGKEIEASR